MKMRMVRIYILEAEKQLKPILSYLHDTAKVRGVTVFRAVTGFGESGVMHATTWVDLSLNLPLTIEFFDEDDRIKKILDYLQTIVKLDHIVSWPVDVELSLKV